MNIETAGSIRELLEVTTYREPDLAWSPESTIEVLDLIAHRALRALRSRGLDATLARPGGIPVVRVAITGSSRRLELRWLTAAAGASPREILDETCDDPQHQWTERMAVIVVDKHGCIIDNLGPWWQERHDEALARMAAAQRDDVVWSAPCQWLASPGQPDREPYHGVVSLDDRVLRWMPFDSDPGRPWEIPLSEVALLHHSRTRQQHGSDTRGFDIHKDRQELWCLELPAGFHHGAVAATQPRVRLLVDDDYG